MSSATKIATLNLCLGLKNKKDMIARLIQEEEIDILCLQETEIQAGFNTNLLTFRGFNYENEQNDLKSRCGIYVSNKISYVRRSDLETNGLHSVIIDLNDTKKTRLINIYRPFNPPNKTQKEFFEAQLTFIAANTNANTIVLGDFNLDHSKKYDINYSHKHYFTSLNNTFSRLDLHQTINFNTWSRVINNTLCTSILDHVYLKDPTQITDISSTTPPFGDHLMIAFKIKSLKSTHEKIYKRNWIHYSKEILTQKLHNENWDINFDSVQSFWNCFECKLIQIVDEIAPFELEKDIVTSKIIPPTHIKNKMNRRSNLIKKINANPSNSLTIRQNIKTLDKQIKSFFHHVKTKNVRRGLKPGNSKSLWDAVKKSKNCNTDSIPHTLFYNNEKIRDEQKASTFADFFSHKVSSIITNSTISDNVFNGSKKINCEPSNFMLKENVLECLKDLKIKNCEGYDRIPQRVLADGAEILVNPLHKLFEKIYLQKCIPEQWSIAKVIPIHKKGPKNNIENYRPISNLCSTSKIFEKLILKHLLNISEKQKIDITGKHQHGFKKNRGTASLAIQLQSIIARALDEDNYVAMASLDLSAAFDVVNIDLLIDRLRVLGVPCDMVGLLSIWLRNRFFYVEIGNNTSVFVPINSGTIQGSILGPILYAIFVAPLYNVSKLSNYADDNFAITKNKSKYACIKEMEAKLKTIIKWLNDSGLKVNEQKTEICIFFRKDTPQANFVVNNVTVKSKDHINVVGVTFDSKLTWAIQVSNQINKSNSALHAIKLIRKYFNQDEIITLLTANFYSILFYNSEVWHLPILKPELKQLLLSASSKALKLSQRTPDSYESFVNVHQSCKRALPNQLIKYKHSILLHKMYNSYCPEADWIDLNFDQILTTRQTKFKVIKSNKYIVGNNLLTTRLTILNDQIPLSDLNLSLDSFKVKYKKVFLLPMNAVIDQ